MESLGQSRARFRRPVDQRPEPHTETVSSSDVAGNTDDDTTTDR